MAITAAGLVVAGATIVVVVDHAFAVQAQRQANDHARYAVGTIVSPGLRRSDFGGGPSLARKRELRQLLSISHLGADSKGATLYAPTGSVAFATTDGSKAVDPATAERVRRASAGQVISNVSSIAGVSTLSTFLPVQASSGSIVGVIRLDRDYSTIAGAARHSALKVAAILEALLLVLSILLVPILNRTTSRLRRHADEMDYAATHDPLTGLLNRLGFRRKLGDGSADQHSLILIDLDDFRTLNDTIGSSGGDAVLRTVAARLESALPSGAIGRLSGDEFGALLATHNEGDVARVARDIHAVLQQPVALDGLRIEIQPRLGATRVPVNADADATLRQASSALGYAKHHSLSLEIFDTRHDEVDRDRVRLATELRQALIADQLVVYYQPQADLTTRAIRGIEALVRWEHPTRGLLLPDIFLPIAEQQGLMPSIDRYVLERALNTWQQLRDNGITLDLSVNVAPIDLLDIDFVTHVSESLHTRGFPPERFVLEITERTLLADDRQTLATLDQLASAGIRLSIDDFGTGYSSLAYLYRLPFRQVKLDKTFTADLPNDPDSDAVIRATVELSHTLNALVVAEGIETAAQWTHVRNLNCDIAQGHLIGKPQPEAQLLELLTRRAGKPTLVAA